MDHRGASPAVSTGSPHTKPVVDPSAPLPAHTPTPAAATVSPPAQLSSGPIVDTPMVNVDVSYVDREASLGGSHSRYVSDTGGYAMQPPTNVKLATVNEVPVFYTRDDSKGLMEALRSEKDLLKELLDKEGGKPIKRTQFGDISLGVFKIPIWLKDMLFKAIATNVGAAATADSLTAAQISHVYNEVFAKLTPSRRLFELIRGGSKLDYITLEDLKTMAKFLVSSHPGLEFLQQPEFQEYYCRTVAIRIMYFLERQQCRRIYWRDFERSDLPDVMLDLDTKDVNQVLDFFSYEHFYVLYCKFWELDTDRDLLVDYTDLCNYGQGTIVPLVIKRVVEGYGRPLTSGEPGRLDFEDFVYFCLSEEDKNSEPAVLYWFKVLDMDSDGILSGYELAEFYKENRLRFQEFADTPENEIRYDDMMCQMLDMLGYDRVKQRKFGVTLGDLRSSIMPANFFNMVFNASKFMMFEHRDPFGEHQQKMRLEKTDWDRFARAEYDRMAAEAQ
ncbi:protein phosphatase 2 (formerly 2A), regulatory subunit B'' [Strigomonas culicis]|uniref:Protein phosphatase 2 (Formerly 2A), regulatory subunit B n=1 Tax=Strigomonas culicis TaxID=28005 RepID=S9WL24_9TRYP|nr:protein phosphatase 2 (formerly 2A), regulatory subunit B'' [Strigomonas culicis]|eukprot:EPY36640.1 protein phosphatase 2 (formerly 2A), regulatory subunit B'' [Strigomonas culicis]